MMQIEEKAPRQALMPRWIWLIVLLGLSLRAYHYFRVPRLWHDEAALVMNVITKNYQELLGPLLWSEAAPPLFLWLEHTVFLALGDNLQALRLLPFLASCASLLLMVPICRLCLPSASIPWALFLFACSENLLWHCCEAKPYALDVLAATLLIFLFLKHRHSPRLSQEILLYALLAPMLIFLCYPACFLYGGILLAMLMKVRHEKRLRAGLLYVGLGIVVLTSFALLALGPAQAQRDGPMESCWIGHFPRWHQPWTFPIWMVANSMEVVRYALKPFGQVLSLWVVLGAVLLWRRKQHDLLMVLMGPGVLVFLAACLHAYPYGASRVVIFLAPAIVLLIALAVPLSLQWLRSQNRFAWTLAVLLLLSPAYGGFHRSIVPWPRADVQRAISWMNAQRQEHDVVLGNYWVHTYYLRHLGERYCDRWADLEAEHPEVAWVLLTEESPAEQRMARLRERTSSSWSIEQHEHFQFTTVARLRRRD